MIDRERTVLNSPPHNLIESLYMTFARSLSTTFLLIMFCKKKCLQTCIGSFPFKSSSSIPPTGLSASLEEEGDGERRLWEVEPRAILDEVCACLKGDQGSLEWV